MASTAAGAYSAIKGADQARKSANQANDAAKAAAAGTGGGAVNIDDLQAKAQEAARVNAANSAALEAQYNPGAQQLRQGSLQALLASLNNTGTPYTGTPPALSGEAGAPAVGDLAPRTTQFDAGPEVDPRNQALLDSVAAQAGQPLTVDGYDSALTRDAIAAAKAQLALGGELPQDVRNLVARRALAKSGTVSGNLQLGRDLTTRDLGLTSLDLYNARLSQALQAGGAEANLEQGNAAMRSQAEQFGRNNLLQSQAATAADQAARQAAFFASAGRADQNYATDAQIQANRDALAASNYNAAANRAAQRDVLASSNYFNQANLFQNIASGDFAKQLAAAQLGQQIAPPQSGLDPGTVANLAVGNSNLAANAAQQSAALGVQAGNQKSALGGQLAGTALGFVTDYLNRPKATTTPAPTAAASYNYVQPYANSATPATTGYNPGFFQPSYFK